jgi:hypothetical protein
VPWCPKCGVEYREGFDRCSECGVGLVNAPPHLDMSPPAGERDEPRETTDWLTAGVFTTPEEAEIARGFLHAAGIAAAIIDKEMHVQPYGMGLLGEVFLRVPRVELDRAKRLLADAERGHAALPDDEGTHGSR